MTESDQERYEVELGPFFTAGALVLVYGVVRRKGLAVVAGLAAIWFDQRSELGRNLKKRVRERAEARIKSRARD